MNPDRKFYLTFMSFSLLLVTQIVFAFIFFNQGNSVQGSFSLLIAGSALILSFNSWKGRYRDVKAKIPSQDDFTEDIKLQAGYYAFVFSIVYWLAYVLFEDVISFDIEFGVLFMLIAYLGSYWFQRYRYTR